MRHSAVAGLPIWQPRRPVADAATEPVFFARTGPVAEPLVEGSRRGSADPTLTQRVQLVAAFGCDSTPLAGRTTARREGVDMSKKGGNKTKAAPKPTMANKGPKKK